ncbi:MAG: sodium:alanine symporter family protein [Oscillospiraceae bacterium]|nr:sodium:alanine symporter family protein [Oscillospiraceae bacterium]
MIKLLDAVNGFVWGVPGLILILSVGILLSVRTGWVQLRLFPAALKAFLLSLRKSDNRGVSSYKALCTALAATVGTGNLAGVAGAIALGGPGAVFWMWICALLGMTTKFAEAVLSVRYRVKGNDGTYLGGPMYIVRQGMGRKWQPLAAIYCFFGVVAAFGVGSATQINTVLGGINGAVRSLGGGESDFMNLLIGIALAILLALVLLGGAKRIGSAAAFLVPFASLFYILLCLGVLVLRAEAIPNAVVAIVSGAFNSKAVTGGVVGSIFVALRVGACRGVFTNEAGMGTAGIAHAAADVSQPAQQGLMGIMEVFIDTIVICTMTALVILCSGISIPYGQDLGIQITADAFSEIYGSWVHIPLAFTLCCLAFATIIGWGLYGARCAQFLFGQNVWQKFVWLQAGSVVLGAVLSTGTVWSLSEIANGLMAIPNLIILLYSCPELVKLTVNYKNIIGTKVASGGTYENFDQRKPL